MCSKKAKTVKLAQQCRQINNANSPDFCMKTLAKQTELDFQTESPEMASMIKPLAKVM